ncbi:hypothetical protein SCORR_v1c03700 [Spiroplasma corruscae]|uniref:Uncharacterized protein n=1 Tax=Spiroplasma corruscae TaxID=216934 RepID=A0A222EPA9_9MOLU|nr:hypothetical protein [Spiroplasma corruscae]ASP28144.1 hypothetical protein SCORR_v1c03700 [Spiroplasma corruscae]
MKKKLGYIFLIPILFVAIGNSVASIKTYNKYENSLEGNIDKITRKYDEWPIEGKDYLDSWYSLQRKNIEELNNSTNIIRNYYINNYVDKFRHYKQIPYDGEVDSNGVPNFEIELILNDIYRSDEIQYQSAYILKALYIESKINMINENYDILINPSSEIVLWSFKYFNALVFYQWLKIWIYELGKTIEVGLSIDFYSFGQYVQYDSNYRPLWNKGPNPKYTSPSPVTSISKSLKWFIDYIYEFVFIKKGVD